MMRSLNIERTGLMVWLTCVTFFLYEYFLRTVVGTFQAPIASFLNLDVLRFSLVSSTAYSVIYGLSQIPIGYSIDKYGLRTNLFTGTLVCALGCLCFALSNAFETAVASRILMGFGSSFGYLCLLVAIYDWLPRAHSGFLIGFSQCIGTLGPIMAAGPMVTFSKYHSASWRELFVVMAVIGVLIALFSHFTVKSNCTTSQSKPVTDWSNARNAFRRIIKRKDIWLVGLFCGCNYFTLEYLAQNNGTTFFKLKGFSEGSAAYLISLAWVSFAICCPLVGWISDRLQNRRKVVISICVLAFTCAGLYIYSMNTIVVSVAFVILGGCCGAQSLGFAMIAERSKPEERAVAMGAVNAMIGMVLSIGAPLIAWILQSVSQGGTITLMHYQEAFMVLLALPIIGIVLLLALPASR